MNNSLSLSLHSDTLRELACELALVNMIQCPQNILVIQTQYTILCLKTGNFPSDYRNIDPKVQRYAYEYYLVPKIIGSTPFK